MKKIKITIYLIIILSIFSPLFFASASYQPLFPVDASSFIKAGDGKCVWTAGGSCESHGWFKSLNSNCDWEVCCRNLLNGYSTDNYIYTYKKQCNTTPRESEVEDVAPNKSSCQPVNNPYDCCCSTKPALVDGTTDDKPALFTPPDIQIKIPGLEKLSAVSCPVGAECEIPWLGQYIVALYNYALSIVGIVAALVLMAGGVMWLISGGDAGKIGQAKEMILGSITGLIILATSYVILLQINPGLVNFTSVNVENIKKVVLNDADVTVTGGTTPYLAGCLAAQKGDLSVCRAYGNSEPPNLVSLDGEKVDPVVAQKYQAAMNCVKAKNGKYLFAINEAWRSAQKQIDYKAAGKSAAIPCCSNHGSGQALDLKIIAGGKANWAYNDSSGLTACMNAQGLYAKLTTGDYIEPWHWSLTGK